MIYSVLFHVSLFGGGSQSRSAEEEKEDKKSEERSQKIFWGGMFFGGHAGRPVMPLVQSPQAQPREQELQPMSSKKEHE